MKHHVSLCAVLSAPLMKNALRSACDRAFFMSGGCHAGRCLRRPGVRRASWTRSFPRAVAPVAAAVSRPAVVCLRDDQRAASLIFFRARTLMRTVAGLAANSRSWPVKGSMPLRFFLAGTSMTPILSRPGSVNSRRLLVHGGQDGEFQRGHHGLDGLGLDAGLLGQVLGQTGLGEGFLHGFEGPARRQLSSIWQRVWRLPLSGWELLPHGRAS